MNHVDGNAIAGVLEDIFGRDVTAVWGSCVGCGARREVGALHVYRAAGIVVRCPDCDAVLMRIVVGRERTWLDVRGLAAMEL